MSICRGALKWYLPLLRPSWAKEAPCADWCIGRSPVSSADVPEGSMQQDEILGPSSCMQPINILPRSHIPLIALCCCKVMMMI